MADWSRSPTTTLSRTAGCPGANRAGAAGGGVFGEGEALGVADSGEAVAAGVFGLGVAVGLAGDGFSTAGGCVGCGATGACVVGTVGCCG